MLIAKAKEEMQEDVKKANARASEEFQVPCLSPDTTTIKCVSALLSSSSLFVETLSARSSAPHVCVGVDDLSTERCCRLIARSSKIVSRQRSRSWPR